MTTNPKPPKQDRSSLRELLAPIVALLILLAFVAFIIYMLWLTAAEEIEWTRAVYLFSGAEAVAFAAAGFFFGSEIQRKRVEKAEERAEDSEERAVQAAQDVVREESRGKALAEAIRAKAAARGIKTEMSRDPERKEAGVRLESLGGADSAAPDAMSQADLVELAELVNRLYP